MNTCWFLCQTRISSAVIWQYATALQKVNGAQSLSGRHDRARGLENQEIYGGGEDGHGDPPEDESPDAADSNLYETEDEEDAGSLNHGRDQIAGRILGDDGTSLVDQAQQLLENAPTHDDDEDAEPLKAVDGIREKEKLLWLLGDEADDLSHPTQSHHHEQLHEQPKSAGKRGDNNPA
ncbi:unnamed protein product [Darwinula stevensoni]|uniref:Uncharacterized protein n=1 Tax=Darwinula stevensoni TaxID=69355 RepID=A0A7R9A847_9CRUS|nr:unnamed protein product [Darwinula stevensoni]CAG0895338.1 unnamed protein product [Darwinula stevensoni]